MQEFGSSEFIAKWLEELAADEQDSGSSSSSGLARNPTLEWIQMQEAMKLEMEGVYGGLEQQRMG